MIIMRTMTLQRQQRTTTSAGRFLLQVQLLPPVLLLLMLVGSLQTSSLSSIFVAATTNTSLSIDSIEQHQHQSKVCSCADDPTGTATRTSSSSSSSSSLSNNSSKERYYVQQIEQLEREVGKCQAVQMAIETREALVKQQLQTVLLKQQQQQQQQQQQPEISSSFSSDKNKISDQLRINELIQELSIHKQRILELEDQVQILSSSSSSKSKTTTIQSSSEIIEPDDDYDIESSSLSSSSLSLQLKACQHTLTETIQRIVTDESQYQEQIEVLEMKLEEFHENELRINEMSQQLDNEKVLRSTMKNEHQQMVETYQENEQMYQEHIQSVEQTNKESIQKLQQQIIDTTNQCTERIEEMELLHEETMSVRIQQVLEDCTNGCNARIVEMEQRYINETIQSIDRTNLECNDRIHELNDQHNVSLQEILDVATRECDDRTTQLLEQLESMREENENVLQYQQQIRELEHTLYYQQQIRNDEKMAHQQYTTILHKHNQQVQGSYKKCQYQHTIDMERIQHVQNELYTLRFHIHTTNEQNRHQSVVQRIYQQYNTIIIQPITRYIYTQWYLPVLDPYILVPLQIICMQSLTLVQRTYIQYYIPIYTLYIKPMTTQVVSYMYALYQQYLIPAIQTTHRAVEANAPRITEIRIQTYTLSIQTTSSTWYHSIRTVVSTIFRQYIDPTIIKPTKLIIDSYTPVLQEKWEQFDSILLHYYTVYQQDFFDPYILPTYNTYQQQFNNYYHRIFHEMVYPQFLSWKEWIVLRMNTYFDMDIEKTIQSYFPKDITDTIRFFGIRILTVATIIIIIRSCWIRRRRPSISV